MIVVDLILIKPDAKIESYDRKSSNQSKGKYMAQKLTTLIAEISNNVSGSIVQTVNQPTAMVVSTRVLVYLFDKYPHYIDSVRRLSGGEGVGSWYVLFTHLVES
jgi:DNA repair exonuclease SbcCD ATPase subunit